MNSSPMCKFQVVAAAMALAIVSGRAIGQAQRVADTAAAPASALNG